MKEHSQIQKFISILMSFILMIELTGCYSTKVISTSDIATQGKYIINSKNSKYYVSRVDISDGILSGKIDFSPRNYINSDRTNVYLSSDSLLKISKDILTVPAGSISKIEQKVKDQAKTKTLTFILVVAGIAIGVGLVVIAVSIVNSAKDIATTGYSSMNNSTGCFTGW